MARWMQEARWREGARTARKARTERERKECGWRAMCSVGASTWNKSTPASLKRPSLARTCAGASPLHVKGVALHPNTFRAWAASS